MPTISYAPPSARVCVHHSFIPFKPSRGLPLPRERERDSLTKCVYTSCLRRNTVSLESYICCLYFDSRFFCHTYTAFFSLVFFSFLAKNKENIPPVYLYYLKTRLNLWLTFPDIPRVASTFESSRVLGRSFRERFNLFSRLHGGKKRQGF